MENKLFKYIQHWYQPVNVNDIHARSLTGINDKIALTVTRWLGTMWMAYFFALLALLGFPGLHASASQYIQWLSQTFIQLVALAILGNGQQIAGRHAELQANEQYNFVLKSYDDVEQIKAHLLQIEAKLEGVNNNGGQDPNTKPLPAA